MTEWLAKDSWWINSTSSATSTPYLSAHINAVCRSAYCQLRPLRPIKYSKWHPVGLVLRWISIKNFTLLSLWTNCSSKLEQRALFIWQSDLRSCSCSSTRYLTCAYFRYWRLCVNSQSCCVRVQLITISWSHWFSGNPTQDAPSCLVETNDKIMLFIPDCTWQDVLRISLPSYYNLATYQFSVSWYREIVRLCHVESIVISSNNLQ